MDMSPIAYAGPHEPVAYAIVLLLCFYPIVAWLTTRRFRTAGGELSRASVPFAVAPQFLGLASTWRQLANVLAMRSVSGGIASTAAGFAEALLPLTLASVIGAIIACCFLLQSRRGSWHRASASWFDWIPIVVLVVWLAATVALARSIVSVRFSVATAWTLAALAILVAVVVFVAALLGVRTSRERVEGKAAFAIPIGACLFCIASAIVTHEAVEQLAQIAMTGRLQ